eukprot:m.2627 g.2627  ORF g.2627 m.2627 type:complete len:228 (-) comp1853_c0_seq1:124-807(-)
MEAELEIAINLAKDALSFEGSGKINEALSKYHSSAGVLMELSKKLPPGEKQTRLMKRAASYILRAEDLKAIISKLKPYTIDEDSSGHSYQKIFGDILTGAKSVTIVEPYMDKIYQCQNLLRFVELCVSKGVVSISVRTKLTFDPKDPNSPLCKMKESLHARHIRFNWEIFGALHDRSISIDNGFTARLGRGLHFFKRVDAFEVGYYDFSQRQCLGCDITFEYSRPPK